MKKLFFLLTFTCMLNSGYSQNLVDNWSFEDTVSCPLFMGDLTAASGWESPMPSSDYFNPCNNDPDWYQNCSVPENCLGYQLPHTGDSYVGIVTFTINGGSHREAIGRQLINPLQIGTLYHVSFYVVRAIRPVPGVYANIAINKIGVNFSTVHYTGSLSSNSWPCNINSQVYSDSIISDTTNWTKISGSFIADSAYSYIGITNFFPDSLTDFTVYGNALQAYYFIDDICVSPDSLYCDQLLSMHNTVSSSIKVFPNPVNDYIQVSGEGIEYLKIYDISGRLIKSVSSPVSSTIDIRNLPEGLYPVAITTRQGIFYKKVVISR